MQSYNQSFGSQAASRAIRELQDQLRDTESQLLACRCQCDNLQNEISLERESWQTRDAELRDELSSLGSQLREVRLQAESMQKEGEAKQESLDQAGKMLKTVKSEARKYKEQLQRGELETQELKSSINKLEGELASSEARVAEVAHRAEEEAAQRGRAEEELRQQREEAARLQGELHRVEKQREEDVQAEEEKKKAEAMIARAEVLREESGRAEEAARLQLARANSALNMQSQMSTFTHKALDQATEVATRDLKLQLSEAEALAKAEQAQRESAEQREAVLQKENEASSWQLQELESELERVRDQLEKSGVALKKASRTNKNVESARRAAEEANVKLRQELEDVQTQLKEAQMDLSQSQSDLKAALHEQKELLAAESAKRAAAEQSVQQSEAVQNKLLQMSRQLTDTYLAQIPRTPLASLESLQNQSLKPPLPPQPPVMCYAVPAEAASRIPQLQMSETEEEDGEMEDKPLKSIEYDSHVDSGRVFSSVGVPDKSSTPAQCEACGQRVCTECPVHSKDPKEFAPLPRCGDIEDKPTKTKRLKGRKKSSNQLSGRSSLVPSRRSSAISNAADACGTEIEKENKTRERSGRSKDRVSIFEKRSAARDKSKDKSQERARELREKEKEERDMLERDIERQLEAEREKERERERLTKEKARRQKVVEVLKSLNRELSDLDVRHNWLYVEMQSIRGTDPVKTESLSDEIMDVLKTMRQKGDQIQRLQFVINDGCTSSR